MHVHFIEIPGPIDIGPGVDLPPRRRLRLPILREETSCRLVREPPHAGDDALSSFAAEFELADFGVPSASIRLADAWALRLMRQNLFAQRCVELRHIAQRVGD